MKKLLSTIKRNGAELASFSEFFYIQEKNRKMDVLEGSMGAAGLRESAGMEA